MTAATLEFLKKAMKSANLLVVVSFIIHLLNNINKK